MHLYICTYVKPTYLHHTNHPKLKNIYVTRFAKTWHIDVFLEIQIFKSVSSMYLKLSNINAVFEGPATVPNHVDGFRNQVESLVELM